ncbi:MAG: hypothetical protein GY861_04890 [bacterium]|nr:hypothetical protein [bacterium]
MKEYHKIQTVFKRDPETKYKTLLEGDFSLDAFDYLKNNAWVFTEKIDGTNIRVMFQDGKVTFGGKTDRAQIPAPLVTKLMETFTEEKMRAVFPDGDACLYGEGYGAKIQKGGCYIPDGVDFILFDVKIDKWWLTQENIADIADKLEIEKVPMISQGTLLDGVEMVRKGMKSVTTTDPNRIAEGLVMRPLVNLATRNGERIITKIKYKDFPH